MFLTFLERSGIKVMGEVVTNQGRIGLVAELPNLTYIFELKLDQSADVAIAQIETKRHADRYLKEDKEIAVVGINFSSETRNIKDVVQEKPVGR